MFADSVDNIIGHKCYKSRLNPKSSQLFTMSPLLALCVVILFFALFWKSKSKVNRPPGPPRLPFVGSYLHLLWIDYNRPYVSLQKLKEYYKSSIISFGMGEFNVIVTCDYNSCKEALNNPAIQGRLDVLPAQLRTYGKKNGLFGNDGDDWLHARRSALRSLRDFGFGRRSDTFESIVEDELKTLVDVVNAKKGQPILLPESLYPAVFNLILYLVHGVRIPPSEHSVLLELGKVALRMGTAVDNTGRLLAIMPWIQDIFPVLSGKAEIVNSSTLFKKFIQESYKKHKLDFDEEVLRDLIDFFIKYKEVYPAWEENHILTVLEDFTFPNAAIAITLSFTLAFLCQKPNTLKRCQNDIEDVVGRGRLPTLNDRQSLPIIEACIKEAMRIQTVVPLGVAHRATEDTTLCGYDIPKDTTIVTHFQSMHNDPKLWGDPENFRPERFLEPEFKDYTLPFSSGKRLCPGETFSRQNLFLFLATILQNFDPEVVVPLNPERYINGLIVAPNSDFSIRLKPRA